MPADEVILQIYYSVQQKTKRNGEGYKATSKISAFGSLVAAAGRMRNCRFDESPHRSMPKEVGSRGDEVQRAMTVDRNRWMLAFRGRRSWRAAVVLWVVAARLGNIRGVDIKSVKKIIADLWHVAVVWNHKTAHLRGCCRLTIPLKNPKPEVIETLVPVPAKLEISEEDVQDLRETLTAHGWGANTGRRSRLQELRLGGLGLLEVSKIALHANPSRIESSPPELS